MLVVATLSQMKDFRELRCHPEFYEHSFEWWEDNEK
tara:strand:+ start:116 stop:223 length:108 start_codon:yes stop_codon:yes gene_type:complete